MTPNTDSEDVPGLSWRFLAEGLLSLAVWSAIWYGVSSFFDYFN